MVMHATLEGFTHHETCRPSMSQFCTQQKLKSPCGQLQLVQLTAAESALQDHELLLTSRAKQWVRGCKVFRVSARS